MAARQRKSTEDKLRELDDVAACGDRAAQAAGLETALGDRHGRVVAKAASLTAAALHYDLVPALVAAFPRFLDNGPKRDPGCLAKQALARALVALDADDVEFFLRGLRCRQLEPVYGGSVDTAAHVRASCAMGLVATGFARALLELTELLADPDAQARLGAVRAIACGNPREAVLLLRTKALNGDPEPAVVGECLSGLLTVEPEESTAFVARFLGASREAEIRELAALALGESRLPEALNPLVEAWDDVLPDPSFRRVLIRAAGLHRSDAACDWLLTLVADGDGRFIDDALAALAAQRRSAGLSSRVRVAVDELRDPRVAERFAELWGEEGDGGE